MGMRTNIAFCNVNRLNSPIKTQSSFMLFIRNTTKIKKKKPRIINKRKGKYTCSKCKEKGMVIISENREFQAKIQH